MPRAKTPFAELGSITSHNDEHHARIYIRNEVVAQMNIRGPSRKTEEQAQKDLEEIRKAGTKGKTREEGLQMMQNPRPGAPLEHPRAPKTTPKPIKASI